MKWTLFSFLYLFLNVSLLPAQSYKDSGLAVELRSADLVSQMTLEEKYQQLLHDAPAIERLGIPAYNWWNEGLHGVARFGRATVFPQPIGMAATFDCDLVYRTATAISTEARAKHNEAVCRGYRGIYTGLTLWSPNINIFRDPRWGRGMETYGEDPFLTGELGTSFVRGLQGDHPFFLRTAACAKHFAVHSGPESERHSFDAEPPKRDLYETYLPAFEKLVNEAHVQGVMTTYSALYGVPSGASTLLLQDLLMKQWHFDGYVVSDCWAIMDFHLGHKYTESKAESAALALQSGINLNCGEAFQALPEAMKLGMIDEAQLDAALIRLFNTRIRLGLFDEKGEDPYASISADTIACQSHIALAREAAQKSIVLLKNDGVLPLKKEAERYYVMGPNAADVDVLLGNYNGQTSDARTIVEGICGKVSLGTRMEYRRGFTFDSYNRNEINWAMTESVGADAVIAVVGLSTLVEGEEGESILSDYKGDKRDLSLPASQIHYLQELKQSIGETPLVVLVTGGGPIDLTEVHELADALLMVWYPGEQGGIAVADVLFGDVNPTGKLPVTFPKSLSDLPDYKDYKMSGRTYKYSSAEPLYPFGYGLSYAYADLSDLKLTENKLSHKKSDALEYAYTISNPFDYPVEMVVEHYVTPPQADFETPFFDLKHFERIRLEGGETKTIQVSIPLEQLKYYDDNGQRSLIKGEYRLSVGYSLPTDRSFELGIPTCLSDSFVIK